MRRSPAPIDETICEYSVPGQWGLFQHVFHHGLCADYREFMIAVSCVPLDTTRPIRPVSNAERLAHAVELGRQGHPLALRCLRTRDNVRLFRDLGEFLTSSACQSELFDCLRGGSLSHTRDVDMRPAKQSRGLDAVREALPEHSVVGGLRYTRPRFHSPPRVSMSIPRAADDASVALGVRNPCIFCGAAPGTPHDAFCFAAGAGDHG